MSDLSRKLSKTLAMAAAISLAPVALAPAIGRAADERESLFVQLDANKDGAVEKSEITEEKQRIFERLLRAGDKNSDGKLTREEFDAAMKPERPQDAPPRREGGTPEGGRPDPKQIFQRLDADGNGKISKEEAQGPLKERFDQIDANGDGYVETDELRVAFEKMAGRPGEQRPDSRRIDNIFTELDKNSDGKLTADEVPAEHREKFETMLSRAGAQEAKALTKEQFVRASIAMAAREGERRPEGSRRPDGDARPEGSRRPDGEGRPIGPPGGFPGPLFGVIDANRDGEFSAEEIANASANLAKLDKNGDGKITRDELMAGMGDRPRGEGDRPRGEGDRPRGEGARPRGEGDRPRGEGDRPRGEGDRPRGEGDRPRGEGDRPRGEGDRPRGEGDRPRGEGDRPRGEGDRPREKKSE